MFRTRAVRILLAIITLGAIAAGGGAYWYHKRYKHLAVHDPGMVYRSAWLEPDALSEVIERYQIRTVVNLCNPGEMGEQRWIDERQAVTNAGARLVELSMPTTINADDPAIAKDLSLLSNPNNYPMLVHCQHGVTRTAKFLAIYDIVFRGMTGDESLKRQPLFGRKHQNVNVRAFVRNFEKRHGTLYPTASADRLDVLRQ